jgi:hypothetical protein
MKSPICWQTELNPREKELEKPSLLGLWDKTTDTEVVAAFVWVPSTDSSQQFVADSEPEAAIRFRRFMAL